MLSPLWPRSSTVWDLRDESETYWSIIDVSAIRTRAWRKAWYWCSSACLRSFPVQYCLGKSSTRLVWCGRSNVPAGREIASFTTKDGSDITSTLRPCYLPALAYSSTFSFGSTARPWTCTANGNRKCFRRKKKTWGIEGNQRQLITSSNKPKLRIKT